MSRAASNGVLASNGTANPMLLPGGASKSMGDSPSGGGRGQEGEGTKGRKGNGNNGKSSRGSHATSGGGGRTHHATSAHDGEVWDHQALVDVLKTDPLYELSAREKGLVWNHHQHLATEFRFSALPKLLRSTKWTIPDQVRGEKEGQPYCVLRAVCCVLRAACCVLRAVCCCANG